jgi:uncharacterized protein (DUF169 family)
MSYQECSKKLIEILGLSIPPVGVKLLRPGEPVPEVFNLPARKMRFCQAIMEANWGKINNILPTDVSCGPGPGYFGAPMGEKVVKGDSGVATGVFGKPEATRKTIGANTRVAAASVTNILVGPVEKFTIQPDTIVVTVNSEEAMWILHSRVYEEGRRITVDIQTEGSFCSGVAIASAMKNDVQIGFGCFGSRGNTDMGPNDIEVGIPTSIFPEVVATLEKLKGPIAAAKAKKGFYVSYPDKKPATA